MTCSSAQEEIGNHPKSLAPPNLLSISCNIQSSLGRKGAKLDCNRLQRFGQVACPTHTQYYELLSHPCLSPTFYSLLCPAMVVIAKSLPLSSKFSTYDGSRPIRKVIYFALHFLASCPYRVSKSILW